MPDALNRWRFWLDVGGTFTDCIGQSPTGQLVTHKVLSTGVYRARVASGSSLTCLKLTGISNPGPDFFAGYKVEFPGNALASTVRASTHLAATAPGESASCSLELAAPLLVLPVPGATVELKGGEPAPIAAIRWLLQKPLAAPLTNIDVRLGTTRGTNALLERRGAKTAFITTAGFGDVLAIAYQNRPELFALEIKKPLPLYSVVLEVEERINAAGAVLLPLVKASLAPKLIALKAAGIEALAICLINSYRNSVHEELVADLATELGFRHVARSSTVAAVQRIVPRGDTTVVDAYLTPVIASYVRSIRDALPEAEGNSLELMTSAGSLVAAATFRGKDSILSGPAGGVVGVARVAQEAGLKAAIGFDMGGTSTDICRYSGSLERRYEMELSDVGKQAGVRLVAPMLVIETVAAGGGSICSFDGSQLNVGPHSAGADPGPACYGKGGPLTITDCNLVLGRTLTEGFSLPLDSGAAMARLLEVCAAVNRVTGRAETPETCAAGFLAVAASNIARPIQKLSLARGFDPRTHTLVSFGGAGAQHACQVADQLGMQQILQHPFASVLSAYGMGGANVSKFAVRAVAVRLSDPNLAGVVQPRLTAMHQELRLAFVQQGAPHDADYDEEYAVDARYLGQDSQLTLLLAGGKAPQLNATSGDELAALFHAEHQRLYGYAVPQRAVELRTVRLTMTGASAAVPTPARSVPVTQSPAIPKLTKAAWFNGQKLDVPFYSLETLAPGWQTAGPALIAGAATSIVIEPDWQGSITPAGHLSLTRRQAPARPEPSARLPEAKTLAPSAGPDPMTLTLFNNRFAAIAEQMGTVLQRTALSINIKERLDFSCAIFTADGGLVVNAPHIPVHLGSMGDTVREIMRHAGRTLAPGDVYVTNDPYGGGSHLPDVTVITPVYLEQSAGLPPKLLFFTGSRAHHAEIGGMTPGSMPPNAHSLAEEGVLIKPLKIVAAGKADEAGLRQLLTAPPYPSRAPEDNIADLHAQIAAGELGRRKLLAMVAEHGLETVQSYMGFVRAAAGMHLQRALRRVVPGVYARSDAMDDGTKIAVQITVTHTAEGGAAAVCDFSGSGAVAATNLNANPAIVKAATLYAFRCLIGMDIPLNEGVLAHVKLIIPENSVLSPPGGNDPKLLAAVTAGNVETSQRLVDVLLGALGLAAASQGTMNNLLFGRSATATVPGFGYYETICGGAGAGPGFAGASAVHTHMTNTRITDPEVLEERFPVLLRQFAIRRGSGGAGKWAGGDGVIRELEFLAQLSLSLITSRRLLAPFGLAGGESGSPGLNTLRRAGASQGEVLPPMTQIEVGVGDVLRLETPGGGGYGASE